MSMGKERYPDSKRIYITADGGSGNKLWKVELQKFANEFGLEVTVSHFPPGTSKWNKIEHRMFSQISKDWSGRPLISLEVIVSLIASTTGLKIKCAVDENKVRENFCDSWNYTFKPQF